MSCNIYEDPDLIMMDDKERVEMLVDIYDSGGPSDVCRGGGWQPQRNLRAQRWCPLTAAALVLVLLALTGMTVLTFFYVENLTGAKLITKDEQNVTEGAQCEPGWKVLNSSCYFLSNETKNWADSKEDCEKRGAKLVIIDSDTENNVVHNLTGAGAYWIGLETIQQTWRWVDNSCLKNTFWNNSVSLQPAPNVKVLTKGGFWQPTNNGSHHWICEQERSDSRRSFNKEEESRIKCQNVP